jgi:hypothetical protein
MRALRLFILLLGVGLVAAGCNNDSGSGVDMTGGGDDLSAGGGDGGDASACLSAAATCAMNSDCCSSLCDPNTHLCAASVCQGAGGPCATAGDCCNLNCVGSTCGATQCISDGQSCSAGGAACCSGPNACQNGTCAQLGTGCHTAGNACAANADCCSGTCDMTSKLCAAPSSISFCTQVGDVCYKDADCCTSICMIGSTGAGTCQPLPAGAGSCLVDGTTCTGCNSMNSTNVSKCCSTYCGAYGSSGSTVCQPAGGCRIQGDLCRHDADCCGGNTGNMCPLPGDGEVKCVIFDQMRGLGTCSMPNGPSCNSASNGTCIPEGDVCHCQLVDSNGICWDSCPGGQTCKPLPSGCSVSGVNANCCSNPGANKMTCRVDAVGVPRCFTVGTCVAAGMACATSADCCNGNVCIPDSTGKFVCGMATCVPTGGKCSATSDCCPGSGNVCIIPSGQTAGVCGNPTPPPPPDGGTTNPDMAGSTCSAAGQQCSASQPCCANAGLCSGGVCVITIL